MVEVCEEGLFLVRDVGRDRVWAVVDEEALVEGFVEESADVGAGVAVELVGVRDQFECVPEDSCADRELFGGVHEGGFESLALGLDLDQLHSDFGLWHGAVRK
ncbi:hypothetical protein [Nocardia crassostreae]|uniref:hypothetical protein n=1 Tax=Nocardia crassostreae TaxID=53428 RepID=UPI001FE0F74E|nr:hypothetical protein [Nocardia crassostreae]